MKRHKALKKSGKGGYFKLTREWPEGSNILGGLQKGVRFQNYKQNHGEPVHPTHSTTDSEEASVTQSILQRFRENKSALLLNKHGVEIDSENQDTTGHSIDIVVVQEASGTGPAEQASATASLEIINKSSSEPVQFRACGFLKHDQAFTLYDDRQVSDGLGDVTLDRGQSYTVTCRFSPQGIGVHSDIVAFTFATTDESGKREFFHIVRYVKGRCTTDMAEEIRSKDKYRRKRNKRQTSHRSIERGEPPEGSGSHLPMVLNKYRCEAIAGMIQNGRPTEKLTKILSSNLEAHHASIFQHLLWVEESQMNIDIRHYDMQNAIMKTVPEGYLALKVPGLAEKRPSLLKGDKLYVSTTSQPDKEFEGYVHRVLQEEVWLRFSQRFHKLVYMEGMKFDVRFTFNRLPLKLQHRTVATNPLPPAVLFPEKKGIGTVGRLRAGPITK
jgi:helicase MOV-10